MKNVKETVPGAPFSESAAIEPKTAPRPATGGPGMGTVPEPVLDLSYIAEDLRGLAVPLTALRPSARNARLHSDRDIRVLAKSLSRFDQQKPVVARRGTGEVVAGNGTLLATQQLGRSHIAVVWLTASDEDALAYALVDNQTALLSSWDLEELGSQLGELRDLDADLPAALGWSDEDLMALLHAMEFSPATEGEQGRLDRVEPITCPACGHEFHR